MCVHFASHLLWRKFTFFHFKVFEIVFVSSTFEQITHSSLLFHPVCSLTPSQTWGNIQPKVTSWFQIHKEQGKEPWMWEQSIYFRPPLWRGSEIPAARWTATVATEKVKVSRKQWSRCQQMKLGVERLAKLKCHQYLIKQVNICATSWSEEA